MRELQGSHFSCRVLGVLNLKRCTGITQLFTSVIGEAYMNEYLWTPEYICLGYWEC